MALIRPCADLRNNYNEISRICHETKKPIYITKNGYNDLVVLSDEVYENLQKEIKKAEDKRIEKLVDKYLSKHYSTFEQFKKDIFNQIDKAISEIDEGKGIPMEKIVAEMEEKYNLDS